MVIKIKTKKAVDSYGVQRREILEITGCLAEGDVPGIYREGEHFAKAGTEAIRFKANKRDIEGTMTEEQFQSSLEELRLCGNALHEAKKKLKELRETWNGEETFII